MGNSKPLTQWVEMIDRHMKICYPVCFSNIIPATLSDRLDVDGSDGVSEVEVTEGLFLLCGAQLGSDGFARFVRDISDDGNLTKNQFRKVRSLLLPLNSLPNPCQRAS